MGKNCSDCLPCKQGLPCGGAHGAQGMQGYGGVRRITNWGGSYGLSSTGERRIDAWLAAGGENYEELTRIIEENYLAEDTDMAVYDQLVIMGGKLKSSEWSKIQYLNQAELLLRGAKSVDALYDVTIVLNKCRKKALLFGGGAILAGVSLSGGVAMSPNKMDDYGHVVSLGAIGWGSYQLLKAYGII
jgi:hypothetical protein